MSDEGVLTAPGALFDLTGKTAIVTGASSGLGWRFAQVLSRAGAKVALAARRLDQLGELARRIEAFDGRAMPIYLDVADPNSVSECVAAAETELGPISSRLPSKSNFCDFMKMCRPSQERMSGRPTGICKICSFS